MLKTGLMEFRFQEDINSVLLNASSLTQAKQTHKKTHVLRIVSRTINNRWKF